MSRRHAAEKREVLPDPKFGNIVVSRAQGALGLLPFAVRLVASW